MKSIAYVALHYGKDFLAWAIRSVQDAVDEIHILYAEKPSFGRPATCACPDSEDELRTEAHRFLTKPLHWHRGSWPGEAAHRQEIIGIARDREVDRILVLDADEVWPEGLA
ncbi:MAG TPA: hypothetical protein VEN81_11355, partial [Planctomycetota bacterium]|nr:hypothetical protein [Planctomycetota bacterium]